MIRKLRKKLIIVLMTILCLLLVAVLGGMFLSAKGLYENRSNSDFTNPPPTDNKSDRSLLMAIPAAMVSMDKDGNFSIMQNHIQYVSDEELINIAQSLLNSSSDTGTTSEYDFRYRLTEAQDGSVIFILTDTFIERDSLQAQLFSSIIIGIGAISLFIVVSLLLSRWMVKPVERAWEKQRQFIADASHELKTPLTVILSNTDMLAESGAVKDEKNKIRLDNIRAESQHMKALTETLLNLASTDNKKSTITKSPVDFSFVLSGAALMFEPTVFDAGRLLNTEIKDNIVVSGDQNQLRRLADILIDNAIRYGVDKSPITIRLSLSNKKEALFSVVSEGAPLSTEECTRIFERFYRVDASRGQTTGFGLGLNIAQGIVEDHGGKIWAESDGVKLNTFYVKIPIETPSRSSSSFSKT